MTRTNQASQSRSALVKKQAEESRDLVANAIAERKLGFMHDQKGPTPPPQSVAGNAYTGYNAVVAEAFAASLGSDNMQFGSASQFRELDMQPRRGEQGVSLVGSTNVEFRVAYDESGKPQIDQDGRISRERVVLDEYRPQAYVVYHSSQMEPMNPEQKQELPAPVKAKRNRHPRETAVRLAEELGVKVRRVSGRVSRGDKDGIMLPQSEVIGKASVEAREIVSAIGSHLHESGRLRSGSLHQYAWKESLVKAMTAHKVGQKMGLGSRSLGFEKSHAENLAKQMRANPERMAAAARDAQERTDFITDKRSRTALRDASQRRARRMAKARTYTPRRSPKRAASRGR